MKESVLGILMFMVLVGCSKSDETVENQNFAAKVILNTAYGNDPQQITDVYLPAGRNETTKTIVLVHGGGWSGGDKSSFDYYVSVLQQQFPDCAVVNINYRLATVESPAYPKQINDIEQMILFLKASDYGISESFALIGASGGAHLSMLYAYHFDETHDVKAVSSIVGPTDFTDPAYTDDPLFSQYGAGYLVGNVSYQQNPSLYAEVSPTTQVTALSPPTIMFYGGQDPLVPASQGPRLKQKLDAFGVYNEFTLVQKGGHGNWDTTTIIDMQEKMRLFLARWL